MTVSQSPARIVRQYLIDQGVFTDPPDSGLWPCYKNHLPDVDGNVGCIYDTAGIKDGRYMSGDNVFFYGVQVAIRVKDAATGWAKIAAISNQLDAANRSEVLLIPTGTLTRENYLVQSISHVGRPIFAGTEPGTKRRFLFTVNAVVAVSLQWSRIIAPIPRFRYSRFAGSKHPLTSWIENKSIWQIKGYPASPFLWYDFTDVGIPDPIDAVPNLGNGGSAHDLAQITGSKQPVIGPHNGAAFDGIDDELTSPWSGPALSGCTTIVVSRNGPSFLRLYVPCFVPFGWAQNAAAGFQIHTSTHQDYYNTSLMPYNSGMIMAAQWDGSSDPYLTHAFHGGSIVKRTSILTTGTPPSAPYTPSQVVVGSRGGSSFFGLPYSGGWTDSIHQIWEVKLWTYEMSDADLADEINALATKHGITLI